MQGDYDLNTTAFISSPRQDPHFKAPRQPFLATRARDFPSLEINVSLLIPFVSACLIDGDGVLAAHTGSLFPVNSLLFKVSGRYFSSPVSNFVRIYYTICLCSGKYIPGFPMCIQSYPVSSAVMNWVLKAAICT